MIERVESQNELFAALAKAQGQFKTVAASRHVNIKMKDGGSYSYNYATLASIMDMLRGPLAANGLSIAQLIAGDELITILGHSSGQSITSTVALPKSGDIKGMGANLTYLRRYSITAIAGVAIDEEDDEAVADGKMETKMRSQSPKEELRPGDVWTPTVDEFFNQVETELKFSRDEAKTILKEAKFFGFKREQASEMYKAIERERQIRTEAEKVKNLANGQLLPKAA